MTPRSWIRKIFARPVTSPIRKPRKARLDLESLEIRDVPATFTVLNTNDSGVGSLRQAVADANANPGADAIVFDTSVFNTALTIGLTSGVITFTDTATTTITGPATGLSVSGGGTQQVFSTSATAVASLSGLTITGGRAVTNGGGVNNLGNLTLTNCTVSGNAAGAGPNQGGGIFSSGTLALVNTNLSGNYGYFGGALSSSGTATLTNCSVSGNSAGGSGAGIGNSGSLTLTGTTVSGNTARYTAGIQNNFATFLVATNSSVSDNQSTSGSAAIGGVAAVTLTNCTISGNTGGGIFQYASALSLTNCTITGTIGAGIILRETPPANLINCTVTGNTVGIANSSVYASTATLQNTIVAGNTSTDIQSLITLADNGHNLLGTALSGTATGTGDVFSDTPLLAPLADYGGQTQTMIPLAGSPALGVGDNTGGPANDQRGFLRGTGAGVDIGSVEGTAYTVTNIADTGAGSLRQAVSDTNNTGTADVILFSSLFNTTQLIGLTSGELDLTDSLTTKLIGPGANLLTISGNDASRVFNINSGAVATLSGLTITGGNGSSGSGVGSGLFNAGTVTLTNCTVSDNTAGGIGGIGNLNATMTLTNCFISGNNIGVFTRGTFVMTNCTVSGNTGNNGAGLYTTGGTLTLTNSTFSGNTAGGSAGGLNIRYAAATLTNCTVSGNTCQNGAGGGVNTSGGGSAVLTNCTVAGNVAGVGAGDGAGGGICGTITIANTIVAGNTAIRGDDVNATITSGGNNLIGKIDVYSSGWVGSDLTGTNTAPLDPQLAALADNGGPTQTMALLPASLAINAGNAANAPTTDQRGNTRFGNTDIGAFEYQFKVINTLDNTSLGSLRGAITVANTTPGTDTIIFKLPSGVQTIAPTAALPTITEAVVIDGTTQTGYVANPLIQIDGTNAGSVDGLTLDSGSTGSTIKGLIVSNFSSSGAIAILLTSANNVIQGNWIGLNSTGTAAAANYSGIGLSSGNLIGTNGDGVNDAAERNVISGNLFDGVVSNGGSNNTLAGNYIGTNAAGTAPINNNFANVFIANADGNLIGTDGSNDAFNANERNVINGGIYVSRNTVIAGNYIGLNAAGTAALSGVANLGIQFGNATTGARIGTNADGIADAAERNVISGLNGDGIIATDGNLVIAGNYIGTNAAGTAGIPNQQGIQLTSSATGILIGTNADGVNDAAEGNLISGNAIAGVLITNSSNGNIVAGNTIGLNATGTSGLPNATGILINGGSFNNTIGGTAAGAANTIAFNTEAGVSVTGTSTGNSIRGNSIYSNGGLGIDLGADGVTTNDTSDADTGPNNLQNYPVLTFVGGGASTDPLGVLNATANSTYTLDFYASNVADPTGYGEGKRYLGSATVTTNAVGKATVSVHLLSATTASEVVTVTATDAGGNTSEFAQSVLTDLLPTVDLATPTDALLGITLPFTPTLTDAVPGKTYQYAWTVTFNGAGVPLPDSSYVSDGATDQETYFFTPQRVGTYQVSVTVTDSRGGVTTTTSNPIAVAATTLGVTITGNPLGTPVPFAAVAGQPITLTNRIADPRQPASDPKTGLVVTPNYTYGWSVTRDGAPFTLPAGTDTTASTLTFTPTLGGLYLASVAVRDGSLAAGADSVSLYNTGAPSADVIVTPGTAVSAGTLVNLRAVVTDVAMRQSLSYAWTITPDNGQSAIQATTTTGAYAFTPTTSGNYVVTLTITDDQNRSGVGTPIQVQVSPATPQVTISGAPQTTVPGAAVTLTGSASAPGTGNTYTLTWTAANTAGTITPATASGSTYTFTPSAAGTVVVTLTATDQNGVASSIPVVIGVAPPAATLTVTHPSDQLQGQQLSWTAALTPASAGTTYAWSVFSPDGITRTYNTGTSNTLTLPTVARSGRYEVTVTASANGFQYTTKAPAAGTQVDVAQAPIDVSVTAPNAFEGDTVTLTSIATEPGVNLTDLSKASYLWTVTGPNGFVKVGVLPTLNVVPLVAGTYTATLTVRDFTGGLGTDTKTFTVTHVPPKPILKYLDTAADGTLGFQAVVSNPGGVYSFHYSVQLNGQTYIQSTPGGSSFTFRIPPLTGPTKVTVTVTDSATATGTISTTVQTVAAGTTANPVTKTITSSDLQSGTNVAVVLALGNNVVHVDPALTAATTVEIVAVGGHNIFYGGASTNIFYGDSGTNELNGGSGPNTFYASGNDTLVGGSGTNLYVPITVDTSTGNILNVAAGTGASTFDLSQQDGVSLDLTATGAAQTFDAAGNQVMLTGSFQSVSVLGSPGADTLTASSGSKISGGGGSDLLKSNNVTNVTLVGGSGNNESLVATGGANVSLIGGSGNNESLVAGGGVANVSLIGGSGNNSSLIAGGGSVNVTLIGGSGNNESLVAGGSPGSPGSTNVSLIGGSGNNSSLIAGGGATNVTLIGGSGNNSSLVAGGGAGNVTLIGGSGNNSSLVAGGGSVNVTLIGGSGNNESLVAGGSPGSPGSTNVSLIGGSGNNSSLIAGGGATNVTLIGGSGNNSSLVAGGGATNVTLIGGSGNNESLVAGGGATNVTLIGGSGNNSSLVAGGGSVNVTLIGGSGNNESLVAGGSPGSPGSTNVSLIGGSGNNSSLIAGGGATNVTLIGGSGNNESLVAGGGSVNVTLIGGSGNNESLIAGGGSTNVSLIGGSGNNESLIAGGGAVNVTLIGGSGNNESLVALGGNVSLIGGSGNNSSLIAGGGSVNVTLIGGSGNNESLVAGGGATNVTLIGGSGNNESLIAGGGSTNVSLIGGSGNNSSLIAGGGSVNVTLIGGSGNNESLVATGGSPGSPGSTNVSLIGGSGNNSSLVAGGGATNVTLIGGSGNNSSLVAGGGAINVTLIGGSGNNESLVAGPGSVGVSLVGGSGNNESLIAGGGSVNVTLIGGSGNNESLGAGGGSINVSLIGGSGNNESLVATGGMNVSLIGGSGTGSHISVVDTAGAILLGAFGQRAVLTASGSSSNVVLIGGFGDNDSLIAGSGVIGAQLVGGFGNNNYLAVTGVNNAVLAGGFGNNNTLTATGGDNVVLLGGSGNNALLTRTGGTNSYLYGQSGNNDSLVSTGGGTNVSLIGGSGNDLYVSDIGSNGVSLLGGTGNNDTVISVNGTNVTVFGGNGNNNVVSASGGTNVFALGGTGDGNQITAANLTNATLFGGAGNSNALTNTAGTNVLLLGGTGLANVLKDISGTGNTLVNGGNGFASLMATGGDSIRLFGGGGTDYLSATGGTNIGLFGQNGDNTYALFGTAANPFSGYLDALGTVGLNQTTNDQLQSGTNTILFPTADKVVLDLSVAVGGAPSASAATAATQSVATGISLYLIGPFSGVVGSATGNDYIHGNAVANSLVAGAGNATLVAGTGDATLVAGTGNTMLVGGIGKSTYAFPGAGGNATITQTNPNNVDVIDLSSQTGPVTLDLSAVSAQTITPTLTLTLNDPTILDVLGSPFGNTLTGNDRDNHFTLSSGTNTVTTGSGLTTLKYTGSALGTNTINAPTPQSVVFNFHQLGAPLSFDLSQPIQSVAGGTIAFAGATDARAVASVVGTIYGDVLMGNPTAGAPSVSLYGGGGRDSLVGGAGNDFIQAGVPQVVFLDFDTYTPLSLNNHVYTQDERDAIQQRMEGVYATFTSTALDGTTTYFNGYVFTQSLTTARALTRPTGGEFVTLYFNKPPVGGQADEVDFANADLSGTASVDASLILGAPGQPDPTSVNFINESAGLAEHELAHLSGLRHTDAFGPIGSGGYEVLVNGNLVSGLDPARFYPIFQQPATTTAVPDSTVLLPDGTPISQGVTAFADETPLHVMGSPASIGISRFDTLNDIFFGEREAIRLSFAQSGVILPAQTAPHDSPAAAQDLGALPQLVVPNTLAPGSQDYGKSFDVSAVAVVGAIGLDATGHSQSDWYAFDGRGGDIMSFETISNVLPGNLHPLDTILRVYDAAGNLLASNDDELESRDSLIFDLQLPANGRYYVQVDTYAQDPTTNTSSGDYVLYMTSFKIGSSTGGGSTLVAGAGSDVLAGGQGNNLFQVAAGAGPVTVISGTGADILDRSASPLTPVTVITSSANATVTQVTVDAPALQFPTGLAIQTVAKGDTLQFSAAVINTGRLVVYSLTPVPGEMEPIGATIRPTDGLFTWSVGNAGTYKINIVATASDGATSTTTVTIVVAAAAPALTLLTDQSAPVGTPIVLSGSVAKPVLGNIYAYSWTITRNSQTVATFTGQSALFNPGVSGTYTASMTITDQQDGLTSTTSLTLTVTEVAPVVNPLPNASITAGGSVSFTASYSYPGDPASLTRLWTVTNSANANVPVTNASGTSFTFLAPDADVYTVTFTVQTASGVTQATSAQVTAVGVPPTATPPAGITIAEGTSATLTFTNPFSLAPAVTTAGFRYSFALSPGGLAATYTATGTTTSPSFTFVGDDNGMFTVYGRIIDKNNAYHDYTTQVVVTDVQIVPTGVTSISATKGTSTGAITVATFTDAGGPEVLSRYAATIDWGDGTAATAGTIGAPVNGVFPVTDTHTYATQGNYTVRVTLTHDSLPAVAVTDAVTVVAPTLVGTGGISLSATKAADTGSVTVATFTDPTGPDALATYSATINWGDGTTSAGGISLSGSTFTVTGGHTYATTGTRPVTVTLKHKGSPDVTVTDTVTVINPALVGQGVGIAATRNSPTGQVAVATFTDPGGADGLSSYSATIAWGDGTAATVGTITLGSDGRTFSVLGGHTYTTAGSYPITVTIAHGAAPPAPTVVTPTAVVSNPAVTPTFSPFAGVINVALTNQKVATFSDPSGAAASASYSATIDWGDGTSPTTGTIGAAVNGVFPVTGTHTYTAFGSYHITVTIVHGSSPAASASGTVSVTYGQVTATGGITAPFASAIASAPVVATFTDPNGAGATSLYSATINWGDGLSSTGTISGPVGGVFSVSAPHTYFVLGSVPITIAVARGTGTPVTVTSTANVGTSIVALNPTLSGSVTLSGAATISITGALVIDSSSSHALTASGSPHVTAGSISIVGGSSTSGASQITPAPITHTTSLADPLAALPAPPNPGGTPINASIGGSSTVTLNPGLYSQIQISGAAKVTMNPGIYVIKGGAFTVAGSAKLTGNGVMIYVADSNYPNPGGSSGGISFSGAATVSLTPATTGTYAGITIFQARDNTRAITFSGSAQTGVGGFVYAENALLTLSGAVSDIHMGLIVDRLNTSGSAASGVATEGAGTEDGNPAGELLATNLFAYVSDPQGLLTSLEYARIDDAIAGIDLLLVPYGVTITEVYDPEIANLVIDFASTTPLGGMSDGILGTYDPTDNEITIVEGWNWYAESNPSSIGANQFDLQTAITHELGHALGLGHNPDAASTMHVTLLPGETKRSLTTTDLNIGDADNLPGALHADLRGLTPTVGSNSATENQTEQRPAEATLTRAATEPTQPAQTAQTAAVLMRAVIPQLLLSDLGVRFSDQSVPTTGRDVQTAAFASTPVIDRSSPNAVGSFGQTGQPTSGLRDETLAVPENSRSITTAREPAVPVEPQPVPVPTTWNGFAAETLLSVPVEPISTVQAVSPVSTTAEAEEESTDWAELALLALVTGCAVTAMDRSAKKPQPPIRQNRRSHFDGLGLSALDGIEEDFA